MWHKQDRTMTADYVTYKQTDKQTESMDQVWRIGPLQYLRNTDGKGKQGIKILTMI